MVNFEEAEVQAYQMMEAENYLTDCVRKLVKAEDFSASVSTVLQTVLNYYNGDRTYLIEYDWEAEVTRNTYEICAPGVASEIDNRQNVPLEGMEFGTEQFRKNEVLTAPFFFGQRKAGFIGVDHPKQNLKNEDFLINLAYFIGVEIEKQNVVHELLDGSCRDSLTGVYNRKGFEQLVSTMPEQNHPIAFGIVDVDHFKMINDNYGHSVGDAVLKEIADSLTSVLRTGDIVFRLGGDEFGLLLNNCTTEAWNTICMKMQYMHSCLLENHMDMAITLSMGICFSTNRFNEDIYKMADNALYYIKRNGRAGCAMIQERTGEKRHWFDDISSHMKTILEYNDTVLFRVELPKNKGEKPHSICGNTAKALFGFPMDATAEECYQRWIEGIDPSYFDAMKEMQNQMLKGVQVECTYIWNHPEHGKINIRTIGNSEYVNGIQVIYGYHHFLRDTEIIEKEDESKWIINAISSIYAGSYYINMKDYSYVSLKSAPNEHLLHIQQSDIREDFKKYISVLIQPEYQLCMQEFLDINTLGQRLKNQSHLDCEYRSAGDNRWYRASFIPVKTDGNGKLTHVLYEVTLLDQYASQRSENNIKNEKSIESLYNHVPGGLVLYEWNGKELNVLHKSQYYMEHYGNSKQFDHNHVDQRIHKDDWSELWQAILKAQYETHTLSHVYRVWDDKKEKYVWEKVDAICENQSDGTVLAYALFSDVTEQKEVELKLQKRHISLTAALNASSQLCYEYDPVEHMGICYTDENFFGLPKYIENYPDSLRNFDLFHPEDEIIFFETVKKIDNGEKDAQCNVRIKKAGEYRWYSCRFDTYFDEQKERNVAILNVVDITMRMEVLQQYEEQMAALLRSQNDSLSMCLVNATQNTVELINNSDVIEPYTKSVANYDEAVMFVTECIVGEDAKRKYQDMFRSENLLRQAEEGNWHQELEYLMRVNESHYEWITAVVDLIKNPITGEISGVAYSKSSQTSHMTDNLLEKALEDDCLFAAAIFVDTDEFYLYNSTISSYTSCMQNFWNVALKDNKMYCSDDTAKQLREFFVKENVLELLEHDRKVGFAFDSNNNGVHSRLEFRFSYLDESRTMLLGIMRDVTDTELLEKYRYANEHDSLTNLYNRSKFIVEAEKIIKEDSDTQYAIVHFDIKNFHLYNTFFGEEAGDQLLCDLADFIRDGNGEYENAVYGRIEADVFGALIQFKREKFERRVKQLSQKVRQYRNDFLIEPKVGVYLIDGHNLKMESMFTRASIAANSIKTADSGMIVYYDETMEQKLYEQQRIVNEMQTALQQEQFKVFLQGKYNLITKKQIGAEALVRWQHPTQGLISPANFIPVFEGNGFIMELDRYMWEHTCQILCKWREEGKELLPISVNVSRISIFNPTTVGFLKELVKKYDIDPKYLELELTESAYVENPEIIKPRLRELQECGFVILMDDFGSGYSSLNSLKNLPVDILKLDMKFLDASEEVEKSRIVISAILYMAHMMNMVAIAEGVETKEQADELINMGCEYAQGFLFAKPLPVEEFETSMK